MAYKSELERFDMERGDVLSIPRETCIELAELEEDAAKVLVPLICYVAGNPGDPVPEVNESDKRMKRVLTGMLHRLIEHQRQNAARRADYLAKQRQNANARWGNDNAKTCHGIPRQANATSISIREEDQDHKNLESSSTAKAVQTLSRSPAGAQGVNAAPGGECATVYEYSEEEPATISREELKADPVGTMLDFLQPLPADIARTRNTLAARMKSAGRDTFVAVCWKFLKDAEAVTEKRKAAEDKIIAYCEANNIERDEWEARESERKAKFCKLLDEADKFDPGGDAYKTLCGRLKPYKGGAA